MLAFLFVPPSWKLAVIITERKLLTAALLFILEYPFVIQSSQILSLPQM